LASSGCGLPSRDVGRTRKPGSLHPGHAARVRTEAVGPGSLLTPVWWRLTATCQSLNKPGKQQERDYHQDDHYQYVNQVIRPHVPNLSRIPLYIGCAVNMLRNNHWRNFLEPHQGEVRRTTLPRTRVDIFGGAATTDDPPGRIATLSNFRLTPTAATSSAGK
jgi:hypothetical protein